MGFEGFSRGRFKLAIYRCTGTTKYFRTSASAAIEIMPVCLKNGADSWEGDYENNSNMFENVS